MSEQLNAKEYIRKLINTAYLNIGIPLLFFIWVYLESTAEKLNPVISQKYQTLVFLLIGLTGALFVVFGQKSYKQNLAEARQKGSLIAKLDNYQRGTVSRFISYSATALLISAGFFLTDFQPFAALFGIMIVLFSINNPNAQKVVKDLKLRNEEKNIILKGLDLPK